MNMPPQTVTLLDVHIDDIDLDSVLAFIESTITSRRQAVISYVNIHTLNLAYENDWFRTHLNGSDLAYCDGRGVQLAAWLTGQKLRDRFTPPDWIDQLCRMAVQHHWPLFFLGAKPGVADQAAQALSTRHPGLDIITHHGHFDHFGADNKTVLMKIRESQVKIILVGMGTPLQDKWISENMAHLAEVNIFLPVGAMFDYIADVLPRGPRWLTDNGFEWLIRLVVEPRRLWRRYLIGLPLFFYRILFASDR